MNKLRSLCAVLMLGCLTACGKSTDAVPADSQTGDIAASAEEWEETEVDEMNRTVLAKALGIDENARSLRFLLSALKTIEAGQIQAAQLKEENGDRVLAVTAENGREYEIYLSQGNSLEAVRDTASGEWLIQSDQ